MNKNNHTSEITEYLKELDKNTETDSKARQAEQQKYAELNEKRDNPEYQEEKSKLWDGF